MLRIFLELLVAVYDPNIRKAEAAMKSIPAKHIASTEEEFFTKDGIDAVLICSPTESHEDYILKALDARKHIFCEKPLLNDLGAAYDLMTKIEESGLKFMMGFNRRFDANAIRLKETISSGEIGSMNMLRITSYDPSPPPLEYLQGSGGLFQDMSIHDFDMARHLTDSEVEEVFVTGKATIPEIQNVGDIDTAVAILTFKNCVTCVIENSRLAGYGYDQRMECLGSNGGAIAKNAYDNQVTVSTDKNIYKDLPMNFFIDRYASSYVREIASFMRMCENNWPSPVDVRDGVEALRIAYACNLSLQERRIVKMTEFPF